MMEGCSCDRLVDMLQAAGIVLLLYPVVRALCILLRLDAVAEKAVDFTFKYHNWLWAGAFIIGAWWLFWR